MSWAFLAVEKYGLIPMVCIAFFVFIMLLFALIYLLKKVPAAQKVLKFLKAKLIWSSVLRSLIQGYFIIALTSIGGLKIIGTMEPMFGVIILA